MMRAQCVMPAHSHCTFSLQVAVVCLVALSSGKLHCKLDPEHCKDLWNAETGAAPPPITGRHSAFMSARAPAAYPTVQVCCKPKVLQILHILVFTAFCIFTPPDTSCIRVSTASRWYVAVCDP